MKPFQVSAISPIVELTVGSLNIMMMTYDSLAMKWHWGHSNWKDMDQPFVVRIR